jgi:hypothetical protein
VVALLAIKQWILDELGIEWAPKVGVHSPPSCPLDFTAYPSASVEECRLLDKAGSMRVEERRQRDEARAAVQDRLLFVFSPLLLLLLVEPVE